MIHSKIKTGQSGCEYPRQVLYYIAAFIVNHDRIVCAEYHRESTRQLEKNCQFLPKTCMAGQYWHLTPRVSATLRTNTFLVRNWQQIAW
jgi:hypothetical protein